MDTRLDTNSKIEHVETVADAPVNSLSVYFAKNTTANEKAPVYKAFVGMPAPLGDLVSEFPIFRDAKTGGYRVAMPGGSFASLKAANERHADGSMLADISAKGLKQTEALLNGVRTAFNEFLDGKKGVQRFNVA